MSKNVLGISRLFWIEGADGRLGSKEIHSRIGPKDVLDQPEFNRASVFFMECRNLHMLQSQFKGVCCAVLLGHRWHLCYCWKFLPDRDCLQLFQWVGPTGEESIPTYFYDVEKTQHFQQHFKAINVRASQVSLIFLNQVSGQLPGFRRLLFDNINVKDGHFQSSTSPPDWLLLPQVAKDNLIEVKYSSFPPDYLTTVSTRYPFHRQSSRPTLTWSKYRLPVVVPVFPDQRRKKKIRSHPSKSIKLPSWAMPPRIGTFHGSDIKYNVVYVQDCAARIRVEKRDLNTIAMPFLTVIEK